MRCMLMYLKISFVSRSNTIRTFVFLSCGLSFSALQMVFAPIIGPGRLTGTVLPGHIEVLFTKVTRVSFVVTKN